MGGSLTIETSNTTVRETPARVEEPLAGDYVVVCVSDTGSGMSDQVLEKAFEPFFTTKEVGKGSGLGLAQVFGFVKQSGGGMRIERQGARWTTVKVYLPRAKASHVSAMAEESGLATAPHSEVILVVDDDSSVREVTTAMLQDLGYSIMEVGSGGAALDMLENEPCPDLLLLDFAMPSMNGADVAREVRVRRPVLPILFVTGYADTAALDAIGEQNIILKPFRAEVLGRRVRAALARKDPSSNGVPIKAVVA